MRVRFAAKWSVTEKNDSRRDYANREPDRPIWASLIGSAVKEGLPFTWSLSP